MSLTQTLSSIKPFDESRKAFSAQCGVDALACVNQAQRIVYSECKLKGVSDAVAKMAVADVTETLLVRASVVLSAQLFTKGDMRQGAKEVLLSAHLCAVLSSWLQDVCLTEVDRLKLDAVKDSVHR